MDFLPLRTPQRKLDLMHAILGTAILINVIMPPVDANILPQSPAQVCAVKLSSQIPGLRQARQRKADEVPRVHPRCAEGCRPGRRGVEHRLRVVQQRQLAANARDRDEPVRPTGRARRGPGRC